MAVSASVVYTGESGNISGSNTGAAFFDRGDALDMSQDLLRQAKKDAEAKREKEKDIQKKWRDAILPTEDLWIDDEEAELNEVIEEYDNLITGFAQSGLDETDLSPEEIKQKKTLEKKIEKIRIQSEQNKAYYDGVMSEFRKDPEGLIYDQEESTSMLEDFKKPGKTTEQRNEIARQKTVLPKRYDFGGVAKSLADQVQEIDLPNNKTGKDPEAFAFTVDKFLLSKEGEIMIKEANKGPEELKAKLIEEFNMMYKPKNKPPKTRTTTAQRTTEKDQNAFSFDPVTSTGSFNGESFSVQNTQNSPGQTDLFWEQGPNTINLTDKEVILRNNDGVSEKVTVKNIYQGEKGLVIQASNQYGEDVWIPYDSYNKSQIKGQYKGLDAEALFYDIRGGSPAQGSATTDETPEERVMRLVEEQK